jgi:CubicO group peptidase (beta-lactamase class C family)
MGPGERTAYNSVAMWALAAVAERLTGEAFAELVRTEIFGPLGLMDSWIGMPVQVYREYRDRFAIMPGFASSGTEAWVTWGRPTGGAHGPIGDLGRFFGALLEHRLVSAPVLEAITTRHLCGAYDETLRATVDRGLGFQLGSSYAGHSFGAHASRRAFGHGGRNWCQALADPVHGLAVAVYWNGRPDNRAHAERQPALLSAVYEDLGLVQAKGADHPLV